SGKTHLLLEAARAIRAAGPRRSIRFGRPGEGAPLQAMAGLLGAGSADAAASLVPRLMRDFARAPGSALERENFAHLIALSLGVPAPGARVRHLEANAFRAE